MFTRFLYLFFIVTVFSTLAYSDVSVRANFSPYNSFAKVYSYSPSKKAKKHHVIFKFADLVTRARKYKEANPDEEVVVKMALYKVHLNVWVGIDPTSSSYGWVGNYDFGKETTEKFLWTIRRAQKAGVKISFLYHKEPGSSVYDYLNRSKIKFFKKIEWGDKASCQMHNKFITVNVYEGDNGAVRNSVYTATSNMDEFNRKKPKSVNLSQSGIIVSNHLKLYKAYSNYFNIIWNNTKTITSFKKAMARSHKNNRLNYIGKKFSAYFFPLKKDDIWNKNYNPIAMMVDKIKSAESNEKKSYVKINTYTVNTAKGDDSFTYAFNQKMENISSAYLHFRSVINRTGAIADKPTIADFDGAKHGAKTHNKVYLFAYPSEQAYYSIIGSANLKSSAFIYKANNLLMVKEHAKKAQDTIIYQAFKRIFYQIYVSTKE